MLLVLVSPYSVFGQLQTGGTPVPSVNISMLASISGALTGQCAARTALSKRWYGVEDLDASTDTDVPDKAFAWPVKCGPPNPVQPIRYCWKDKRSVDNLEEVLNHAIARWAPAMQDGVSALSIDLDDGTGGDKHVFCSDERVSADALEIFDATADDDEEDAEEVDSFTTTGYDYYSDDRGRHHMWFGHLDPNDREGTLAKAIVVMIHELGSVLSFVETSDIKFNSFQVMQWALHTNTNVPIEISTCFSNAKTSYPTQMPRSWQTSTSSAYSKMIKTSKRE